MIIGFCMSCLLMTFCAPLASQQQWILASHSTLKVDGKTNINSFACDIPSYGRTDTIWTTPTNKEGKVKAGGELAIQVGKFDCHHKMMTKDLQKTLKVNEYPLMKIRFTEFSKDLDDYVKAGRVEGEADIELAGVTRHMNIALSVIPGAAGQVQLIGVKQILFSDFNLKPPSKLGGAIKVKNELLVEFRLYFQAK